MPQPFTPEQRIEIRKKLIGSARRHAVTVGVKHTTLEALTSDAGISKSTFYQFYDCKEHLFLDVLEQWEQEILAVIQQTLAAEEGQSGRRIAASVVSATFSVIAEMDAARFLRDDMPLLVDYLDESEKRTHMKSMSGFIFDMLKSAGIRFIVDDDVMMAVIHMLFLCVLHMPEMGDLFMPAFQELVLSACDRMCME